MVEDTIKRYFIFQEGEDLLLVVNAPEEQFDEEVIQGFWEEVRARKFEGLISCDVEKVLLEAERGEIVRIGGTAVEQEAENNVEDVEDEDNNDEASTVVPLTHQHPFEIEIHRNNFVAMVNAKDTSKSITTDQVYAFLKEVGIVYGIIDENIEILVKKFPSIQKVKVAEGTPSVTGEDAKIENAVSIKTDLTPTAMDHGQVDFKKLNLISPIKIGDVIQMRTPPTSGEPGIDIFGNPIPARDGKDKKFKKGKNSEVSEDGCSLVATDDGFLFIGPGGAISVLAIYVVDGDVDYHTGTIEYKGDVVVKGDVRSGFNVFAGGNIFVNGSVEDCTLDAKGGIEVNGGVCSSGEAVVKSGADVKVNFAENAHLEAAGNIFINREAMNCRIIAGGDVEVSWAKGRIIGGSITTGGWVFAPTIGAAMEGHLELAFEPNGWEPHFKKISKIDSRLTGIGKDKSLSDHEKAQTLEVLVNERVNETTELDDVFEYSFATAYKFQPPIHMLFGKIVHRITSEMGPATISFKGLEIRQGTQIINAEQREKLRKRKTSGVTGEE